MLVADARADRCAKRKVAELPTGDAVSLFAALRDRLPGPAMLFEGGLASRRQTTVLTFGKVGELIAKEGDIAVASAGSKERFPAARLKDACRTLLDRCRPDGLKPGSPLGAYGVAAFECAGYFERLPRLVRETESVPDLHLVVPQYAITLAPRERSATVFSVGGRVPRAIERLMAEASTPPRAASFTPLTPIPAEIPYLRMVARAKTAIVAGEIFQIVLSQGWASCCDGDPLVAYRRLRAINPSPYQFFVHLPEATLFGTSPEMLCRLRNGIARIRPLAGTRARPRLPLAQAIVAHALLRDPKERAEHVMLVDLARNDLGSVCEYGSVRVEEFMRVERFSHVMHLVSDVRGRLRSDRDAFDLFAAAFPAGTVSGAPKIRAMELIAELEGRRRGPYGGAVIKAAFDGSLEASLVLRSAAVTGRNVVVRAGAGIVADSVAAREDAECRAKARAVAEALAAPQARPAV